MQRESINSLMVAGHPNVVGSHLEGLVGADQRMVVDIRMRAGAIRTWPEDSGVQMGFDLRHKD